MILYWIKDPKHTEINFEGYVGITKDFQRRKKEHINSNRFPKNSEYIIIYEGTKRECKRKEYELRPFSKIGWNLQRGGMLPPDHTGVRRSENTRRLISENNVGMKGKKHSIETRKQMSKSNKPLICCLYCGKLLHHFNLIRHTDTHRRNKNV
jgi:hypothetical protein